MSTRRINRRTVLLGIGVGVATIAATLGCVRSPRRSRDSEPPHDEIDQAVKEYLVLSDVKMPCLLFFPERRSMARGACSSAAVKELRFLSGSAERVEVLFSTGETRDLHASVSAAKLRLQGDYLSSVQLKNLAAWLFESWWHVRRKAVVDRCQLLEKDKDLAKLQEEAVYYRTLAEDFAKLQEETVLDHVTPAMLFGFGIRLESADNIRGVIWTDSSLVVR